ncbi:MAG: histidinol-phosphate transaminase [Ruminococcus sp.]|nr:histidinol-phosphate transaminase [Ruminococcus sp.]
MKKWEENVRKVVPYVPGEQPKEQNLIKLNTNENPYPPSPKVFEALQHLDAHKMRLYPDPTVHTLVKAIADFYHLKEEQVFVGVGSDDVLAMIFMTFFNSKKPLLFPDITYSFYDVWAEMLRIPYERIPLKEDFTIDINDYMQENGGIIFANPNAPTGNVLSLDAIETIVTSNPDVIVVVDEAYVDFGGESALPLIETYDNLLVVQTFSKSRSMAGMRIGYAMGNPELITYLNAVKHSYNSYTMNQPSILLGTAAIEDKEYFEEMVKKVIDTREWTKAELKKLGFSFPDSKANFIFATHESCPAEELFHALRKEKIIVRYFKKPRIDNYLRISIGTQEEMEALIAFLKTYLESR